MASLSNYNSPPSLSTKKFINSWRNLIEKRDFFTLAKGLIEIHYDPKYKN